MRTTPRELYALRKRFGLTQQEFASLLGLASATISRWESGLAPTGTSLALLGLIYRALKQCPASRIVDALSALPAADDIQRLIVLVHLGDEAGAEDDDTISSHSEEQGE